MILRRRPSLSEVSPHPEGTRLVCVDAAQLDADAVALEALARLALAVRGSGRRLLVRGASSELARLIELAGLTEALGVQPLRPGSTPPRC